MPLNLRRGDAETLTVPPSGERRLLGLIALPVLVLDVVCALGVIAADEGASRTLLLAVLGLGLLLTLLILTLGPGLLRNAVPMPEVQPRPTLVQIQPPLIPAVPVQRSAEMSPEPGYGPPADLVAVAARRNQALVGHQMACLDQLSVLPQPRGGREKSSTSGSLDVQTAVWRLGELAARLRRNSESLLVMTGQDTERRVREPMALPDVIAMAKAEIENSSRVSVVLNAEQAVRAHLVLLHPSLIHHRHRTLTHFHSSYS